MAVKSFLMRKSTRIWGGTFLLLVYLAVVAYLCFGQFDDLPSVHNKLFGIPIDKVVHFTMFFPAAFLLWLAYGWCCRKPWQSALFQTVSFVFCSCIAAGTEIIQKFIPHRTCDSDDFFADVLAIAICCVFTLMIDLILNSRCIEKS